MSWPWSDDPPAWAKALGLQLQAIDAKLNRMIKGELQMAIDLSKLQDAASKQTTVTQSVVNLMQTLAAQIDAIPPSSDPATQAALDQIVQTLNDNDDALASAVTANTRTQAGQ
jgi:hypothetical protein